MISIKRAGENIAKFQKAMGAEPKSWASTTKIHKHWGLGRLSIIFDWRNSDGYMGRFGGGWQWKLGFECGSLSFKRFSIIFSLLVADLRITLEEKK